MQLDCNTLSFPSNTYISRIWLIALDCNALSFPSNTYINRIWLIALFCVVPFWVYVCLYTYDALGVREGFETGRSAVQSARK